MNQYATPAKSVIDLVEQADSLNCDAIFMVKRIRAAKNLREFEHLQNEYDQTATSLYNLSKDIDSHEKSAVLTLRTAKKRAVYALDYMRREFESKVKKLESESSVKKPKHSVTSAALLAKFIINEALKLNARYKPNETTLLRVSTVPDKAQLSASKLAQVLQNEVSLTDLSEVNPLDGMDSLT